MKTFYCFLVLALVASQCLCSIQRYSVKGKFLCGTAPASGVKVKLIDIDFGSDDTLDTKTTGGDGSFLVDGQTSEIGTIEPVLKAYHDCIDNLPGQRRLKLTLPEKYIKKGGGTPQVLDIGVWNLELVPHGEERDYIN